MYLVRHMLNGEALGLYACKKGGHCLDKPSQMCPS